MKTRLALLATFFLAAPAAAQHAEPAASGAPAGYELALSGAMRAERGHPLALSGVAYEVEGLATLRARAGLVVDAAITARQGSGYARRTVQQVSARTDASGRFDLALSVPREPLSAPVVELLVHRSGQPGRRFTFPLDPVAGEAIDLLTDRERYEPGERVRVWARVRSARTQAPRATRPVRLALYDLRGRPLGERSSETGASGVVTAELTIPEDAETGSYRVVAEVEDGASAARSIEVWRRTVERLLGEVQLRGRDPEGVALVAPGGLLRGQVWARTPSGTPVRGATVELRIRPNAEPVTLTTGDDGAAPFEVRAPAFLSGDVGHETLTARIVHAAYGTITASARYLMARVRAVVEVTPRGGWLVPEVPGTLMLAVADPRGRPLPEGTRVVVEGAGIRGGRATATLDARSLAEVSIVLPRGAAAMQRTGPCSGRVATTVEVEVQTDPPVFTRACAPVSVHAEVAPRVLGAPVVAPGQTVDVSIERRSTARGLPVLVEAVWSGRPVAFAWVDGRESQTELMIPDDLLGVVAIRARAAREADARKPATEPGASAFTVGAYDAVLVRPADAFRLTVTPELDRYLVRQEARVELAASRAPAGPAWAALVVRDEAAHGGEGPWDLYFLRDQLHEAAWQPASEANARMVRVALSNTLGMDPEPPSPPPLELPYWAPPQYRPPYNAARNVTGVLRDPVALREELLRRGLAPVEQVLERVVASLGADDEARARVVQGRAFHPDVIAHLIASHQLAEAYARTLGGEPLTIAMIEGADPGFSFDTVARRVARSRLARLLLALSRLADPDDPNAQRASAQLPPERWLGTLVQLGMVQPADLLDPWGRPFVFRRVSGRPRVAVSERALAWELASPGPDGRAGTADDVNDPFARAVPEGTPYAINSGEEALLRRFGTLAPAQLVLTRMSQAYDRVALAATEEQRQGPVTAATSEVSDEMQARAMLRDQAIAESDDAAGEAAAALGGLSGFGAGRGRASRSPGAPPPPAAMPADAEEAAPMQLQAELDAMQQAVASRSQALGAIIREDFPATLFFVGEVPLDGQGAASVEVPLADALTTYRLEAIAWTSSGWTTSGAGRVRVDQTALVDAPVPPYATAGDRLRLPVRVENRTDAALPVRITVQAEGLALSAIEPVTLEVPAREAREAVVVVHLEGAGQGALVVSVASLDGEGLDAVRRPITVLADARTARERRLELVDGTHAAILEVPAEASARGPGQLTLSIGARLFGEPAEVVGDPLWAGWALAMAGEPLSDALREPVLSWVSYEDDDAELLREPARSAIALGAAWSDERLTDEDARRALRSVGQRLPAPELSRQDPASAGDADMLLLGLAPVAQHLDRRPAVRADAERLIARLQRLVGDAAAGATDAPLVWARAAASLALTGGDRGRASEMVRRAERSLVRVGDAAWIEPERSHYAEGNDPRAHPTALFSLAMSALGRRSDGLALVRSLLAMRRPAEAGPADALVPRPDFSGRDLALASAAAARLSSGRTGNVRVTLDGRVLDPIRQGGVWLAALPGLGRPGRHELRVSLSGGAVALAQLTLSYGMPWDVAPRRRAPIELAFEGDLGPRDARSGLLLTVRNRGARILTRPVVEIELPAGAELDEPTRDALASHLRGGARQEGRTLILPLRALAPGGWVRLPLRARWAVGGTLRGLGAVAYDDVSALHARSLPVSVLPSHAVEIADEGPEPESADAERSAVPIPPPIPILERLTPGA